MSVNLLTNRRRKTRGGSVYADGNQTEAVANTNQEPIGRASITSDLRINEEPTSQNTLAPMRTRTIGFDLPSNVEDLHSHKAGVGETTRTQPRRPEKLEAKGDEVLKDNTKRRGNAREDMQARFTAAKSARVWDTYVRKAEEEDKDLVEDWDRVIDVTLVFAALFSAISTGFVLESSKGLQPDQAKATVLAVQSLASAIQVGANGSTVPTTESYEDSFKPTVLTIWVNCLWFLSLGLSISVSLFAMLAKRWCYVFRSKRTGTSHERATKRQQQWDAIEKWKIELVIEQLPTLMHIALMLFFFGLVVYLAEIHQTTMIVTGALAGFTIVLYFILTALPLWYPNCPMVTPFTRIVLAIRWYTLEGFKFISTQTWWHSENASVLSRILNLRQEVSKLDLRKFLGAAVSAPKQTFRLIRTALISLWAQPVRLARVMVSFTEQENLNNAPEWVMYGHTNGEIGQTVPRPRPDETNPHAFNALAWILSNTTDSEVVKEVLDYIMSFPEVILDSFAGGNQLYIVASTATEHLTRLQHDPAEWRRTTHINSSCARLIYLTTLPWLHKSKGDGSGYAAIYGLLSNSQVGSTDMSSEELDEYVSTINQELARLSEPVLWLEDLAGKVVLGCTPKLGLKICTALGRTLLNEETRLHARHLDAELYPTLWWIFLSNVMDCTFGYWPSSKYEEGPGEPPLISCASNSALTLSYFRDSRKRQENGLWLAIVGITGMLYAFTQYPDGENGSVVDGNGEYFARLIDFLRATLRNSLLLDTDPFLGCLPVYNKTEIRLYRFDSLQYGIDAVTCALDSPIYASCSFSSDLRMLLHDLSELKVLKDLFRPKETQEVDHSRILGIHKSKALDHNAANIFLTTGALLINPLRSRLGRECARLLASLVSDIIFGSGALDPSTSPTAPKGCIGMVPTIDQYITASSTITNWAWMPFEMSIWLPGALKTKYPQYRYRNMLWEPLEGAGLLQDPIIPDWSLQIYSLFSKIVIDVGNLEEELKEAYRAVGYCLYIKASLLDRLHSSSAADTHSPDVLAWSIALSHHVVELLQFWDAATFDPDEQTYIIGSLGKLINTLLDALNHTPSLEPIKPSQNPISAIQGTPKEATNVRGRLEALIKAGVLSILARPFSPRSQLPTTSIDGYTPEQAKWDGDLTRTIERLARTFPTIRAERGFATSINDTLRVVGKPEWAFNQQPETLGGDGGNNNSNSHEVEPYSDMVAYYEAKALENIAESLPMLEIVKRLRDDVEAHHPPTPPRVESPDVRIDISQDR